ncbi:MAG TPA: lasso peptide biosynthesis B2 protein [Actinomycetota bacterium]|nr:lasso peptide biosynthesis B2 protein [Actinomycetota bacterium]
MASSPTGTAPKRGTAARLARAARDPAETARRVAVLGKIVAARAMIATGGFRLVRGVHRYRTVEQAERPLGPEPALTPAQAREIQRAIGLLDRLEKRVSCLPRSVVLERVCRKAGVPAEIVIGVDRSKGFAAHAWVEIEGYPLGATEAGRAHWNALGRFRRDGR